MGENVRSEIGTGHRLIRLATSAFIMAAHFLMGILEVFAFLSALLGIVVGYVLSARMIAWLLGPLTVTETHPGPLTIDLYPRAHVVDVPDILVTREVGFWDAHGTWLTNITPLLIVAFIVLAHKLASHLQRGDMATIELPGDKAPTEPFAIPKDVVYDYPEDVTTGRPISYPAV